MGTDAKLNLSAALCALPCGPGHASLCIFWRDMQRTA